MKMKLLRAAGIAGILGGALVGKVAYADEVGMAFSPLSLDIPALKGLSEAVKRVGSDQGYDVVVLDPKFDAPTQAQQLNQLFGTGRVKAAWVIAVNPGAMGGVIDTVHDNGGVVLVNGEPKDYGFDGMVPGVSFGKIDYEGYGAITGALGGECANKDFGGKGKALLIGMKEGTAGKAEIEGTMEKKLTEVAPGVDVVASIIATERADALTKVSQVLQAHPDLNIVVSANDEGALGAMGAFEAAGNKSTCIVASGGNDEVLKSIGDSHLYGAAALNFKGDMVQTFETIAEMLKDPSAPGKQLYVPMEKKERP